MIRSSPSFWIRVEAAYQGRYALPIRVTAEVLPLAADPVHPLVVRLVAS